MIMTRSPLRISLGGGGTDLPSYYQEHSGFLVAAAIDKYVYILMHHRFVPRLLLKYSQMEEVERIEDIKHPLIREALKLVGWDDLRLEITSMADIPAGTGLGSSGSFTTALLKALHVAEEEPGPPARARRAGVQDRDRHPQGAGRQAGPVHRGLRRDHLLPLPAQRPGRGLAAEDQPADALRHGGPPAAVLHRLHAIGRRDPQGAGRPEQEERPEHDRQPAFRQADRPRHQGRARGGRPAAVRRADEHALGVQEGAVASR